MTMHVGAGEVERSRVRVLDWFARTAPLIEWAEMESPLGELYMARSEVGLCKLMFGVEEDFFRENLPARARAQRNPDALQAEREQLAAWFDGRLREFTLPVDLGGMTAFQQRVLHLASAIPAGVMRTYGELARDVGSPRASRAVGQALGRNPVPIVIPCHRVVGSNGRLTGYSGGHGIESKRWLLRLEGALTGEAGDD